MADKVTDQFDLTLPELPLAELTVRKWRPEPTGVHSTKYEGDSYGPPLRYDALPEALRDEIDLSMANGGAAGILECGGQMYCWEVSHP